jgi:ferritin-like metal-binding protein YciE
MAAKRQSSRNRKESPTCNELLVLELQEIHSAENQLARVLPRLMKSVESEKLQKLLQQREEQGGRLIEEIEAALEEMDESPGRKKNVAAEGLINDAREHVQELEQGPALDGVLIAAIQKTEHYCIAAWGTARSLAQADGQKSIVRSMENALEEGKKLDQQLTPLAEEEITPALMSGESASEDSSEDEGEEQPRGRSRKSGDTGRRVSGDSRALTSRARGARGELRDLALLTARVPKLHGPCRRGY